MSARRKGLKVAAIVCIGATVLGVGAWSWMAFRPTGISGEVARVKSSSAAFAEKYPRMDLLPPDAITPDSGYRNRPEVYFPGQEEVQQLEAEARALRDEQLGSTCFECLSLIFHASPIVATASIDVITSGEPRGMELPERISPELEEDLMKQLFSFDSYGTGFGQLDESLIKKTAAFVGKALKMNRRISQLHSQIPDGSPFREALRQNAPLGIRTAGPEERPDPPALERLRNFLDDDANLVRWATTGMPQFPIVLDLWDMKDGETGASAREEIAFMLDEVDARYADVDWQRSQWEMRIVKEQRLFRHTLPLVPYTGTQRWQDYLLNGLPMKIAAETMRPMILREGDAYAAALLRHDSAAATKSHAKLRYLIEASGINAIWPRSSRQLGMQSNPQRGTTFRPIEIRRLTYLLRIAAAVAFFRADTGHDPSSINELIPGYLPAPPNGPHHFALIPMKTQGNSVPLTGEGSTQMAILQCSSGEGCIPELPSNLWQVRVYVPMKSALYEEAWSVLGRVGEN